MKDNTPTIRMRLLTLRQRVVNRLLSLLYGQPMQVLPAGHVGLAGAVVLWYLQDGFRHFILLRSPRVGDGRARFVSCLGLGKHPDMPTALKAVLTQQCGEVFTRTVESKLLTMDRVASVPLFSYADDALGIDTPVQALVWVVQVQPAQVDIIETQPETSTVLVPEFAMSSNKISSTHKALYQAVQRQLPKLKLVNLPTTGNLDDAIREGGSSTPRTIH